MNVSDRSIFGCSCCSWEKVPNKRDRKIAARRIKRADRQAWKKEVKKYM